MVNIPGTTPQMWDFSVRDDSIAQIITRAMGQRLSLTYDQHGGVPTSCFGDTEYFVTGVRVLGQ
jgi:NADH:ubiquinone oxidoreductase subunit D